MPVEEALIQGWYLFQHFALLSLISVSGAIATVPDMQRYLVQDQQWLSPAEFSSSVAIAQAAPGPNVLFVGLMGWHVGLNAAGGQLSGHPWAWLMGLAGMSIALCGILLPSSVLCWWITRWAHQHREHRAVRAFRQGMAPLVVGLIAATGWILGSEARPGITTMAQVLLIAVSAMLVARTRIHLLWLLGAGALIGAVGGLD